jgi:antitoxin ParD1/3/4
MTIDLDNETQHLIEQGLQSGRFTSAAELVREAVHLLEQRDRILALRAQEIRKQIGDGIESLRRGMGLDGEAVFDRIEAELDTLERSGHQ